jgi:hypothetical protein
VAERWLAEARVARDTARFALPRSRLSIGAGDVVELGGLAYRVDRLETSDVQLAEAVRVDQGAYRAAPEIDDPASRVSPPAALPVHPTFLDIPLLTGTETPHAPHIAISASPWPGPVAIWSAVGDAGYSLNTQADRPATFGVTQGPLPAATPGLWDSGLPLRIRLSSGQLSSLAPDEVLNGANTAAIGDGSPENWEIFQFASAELVAPRTYDLSLRLRGQVGTDALMPAIWPTGSHFVLLDDAVPQIALAASARGLERFYRVGAADRGYSASDVVVRTFAFNGIGLRPYSVAHLNVSGFGGADAEVTWIRRTRIEGDSWLSSEVPLGEDGERYLVRIYSGMTVLRAAEVSLPAWTYTSAMQAADSAFLGVTIAVAQVSTRFGPGPFRSVRFG